MRIASPLDTDGERSTDSRQAQGVRSPTKWVFKASQSLSINYIVRVSQILSFQPAFRDNGGKALSLGGSAFALSR